jgi:hypothetical protein
MRRGRFPSCLGASAFLCVLAFISAAAGISGQPSSARAAQPADPPSGWVVLPVDHYKSLRSASLPSVVEEPAAAPVDAALTQVDYDLAITNDVASGTARLTIDVLKEGWVRVPLPDGLLVAGIHIPVRSDSRVISTLEKGGAGAALLFSRPGRFEVNLDVNVPIASEAGTERLTVPAAASGISRLAVQLPRSGIDVRLGGGILLEKSESVDQSRWVVCGSGGQPLALSWRTRVEDRRSRQPLRLRGAITQVAALGEDLTQVTMQVRVEVVQGQTSEVRLQLPERLVVNQVSGAVVADWQATAGSLVVAFLEPIQRETALVITGERPSARDGRIEVPIVRLSGVERETGGVAVEVLGAGEIRAREARGLQEVEASELGEPASSRDSPSLVAFRLLPVGTGGSRSLAVTVSRYTPQAVLTANIEEARYEVLLSPEGKALFHARYAVRNNQRNFLKAVLPADSTLWSAAVSGHPVRPGRSRDGGLLLPLEKGRSGEQAQVSTVDLLFLRRGAAWSEKGQITLPLAAVDLPISKTGLQIYYSPVFRLTPRAGAFRIEPCQPPSAVFFEQAARQPASQPGNQGVMRMPANQMAIQALADSYQAKTRSGRTSPMLSAGVAFPGIGPFLFFLSELTTENQTPTIEFEYAKTGKRGGL